MKTKLSFVALLLASSLSLSVSPAFAEETASPTGATQNRSEFLEERAKKIEAKVTDRQEHRDAVKATITQRASERQEHRSEIAQKHAENLELRFNEMYKRLSTMATRIQSRIDAIKAQGKDTSTAQSKLDAAKTSLESAKSLGQEAVTAFKAIDPAKYDEQRSQALAARDKANQARQAFVTALQGMKDAVSALQALHATE